MNQAIEVITESISLEQVQQLAKGGFGDMVKGVADIRQGLMALGGELHADEEAVLLEKGSPQADLRGFNLYPDDYGQEGWVEFYSMINIRPSQGNLSRSVEDESIQAAIRTVVDRLVRT